MNKKRIQQIEIENKIWIIYFIIIGLSYYGNYYEKDYFEKEAVNSFREKNKSKDQKKYDTLSLIATTAVLISGIIFLYIIVNDKDLDEEIAFN